MTTEHDRRGALEAVERIVNRGDGDVVAQTLDVLRRLYPEAAVHSGSFVVPEATDADRELIARVALLVSHFSAEDA